MPLPQPAVALTDACSVLFNNTLYTYSANAFQSLELTQGAQWTTLPAGESVTGGVCVGSTPGDSSTAAFFVVGGTAANNTYQGVQKFTYSRGTWETLPFSNSVAQDRLYHGAAYINSSDSILIYAGHQDGTTGISTSTFTIGASAPYSVLAYESTAPPVTYPILVPWSATQVAMIGGSTTNSKVMLFNPSTSWVESGATLAQPLTKDITSIQATVVTGDDGSKNLYTFDATLSPNQVNRTILIDGSGHPVQAAVAITKRWINGEEEERSMTIVERDTLTEANWPTYNSSLASTTTRNSYSLATSEDGEVVISGGTTSSDVLCVFNAKSNAWINATAMLSDTKFFAAAATSSVSSSSSVELSSSTSASSSSTSASTTSESAAATSTAAAAAAAGATDTESSTGTNTNAILAAVLGSIFGLAVILFFVYWFVRRQRAQQKQQLHREDSLRSEGSIRSTEKNAMEYAGDTFPQPPTGGYRGHQPQESAGSFSSMAILMGKVHQSKPSQSTVPRNFAANAERTSMDSTFNKAFKDTISKPIPQADAPIMARNLAAPPLRDEKGVSFAPDTAEPRPRNPNARSNDDSDAARRSSGWNRYWSGGSALNILGFGSGNGGGNNNGNNNTAKNAAACTDSIANHTGKRITIESDLSEYSNTQQQQYRITQDSATVPPLNVYEPVSPQASFSRVNTGSPTLAQFNPRGQVHQEMSGSIERPVSAVSALTDTYSAYSSGVPTSLHDGWDPTRGNDLGTAADWADQRERERDRAASSFYSASVYTTPLAPASYNGGGSRPPTEHAPMPTRPPRPPVPSGISTQPQLQMAATSTDMSWLNLGSSKQV